MVRMAYATRMVLTVEEHLVRLMDERIEGCHDLPVALTAVCAASRCNPPFQGVSIPRRNPWPSTTLKYQSLTIFLFPTDLTHHNAPSSNYTQLPLLPVRWHPPFAAYCSTSLISQHNVAVCYCSQIVQLVPQLVLIKIQTRLELLLIPPIIIVR